MLHPIEVGKKIIAHRKKLGISQSHFAKLLGVSNQAVSKWENGNSLPDITNLVIIAEIFNIKINELLDYQCIFDDYRPNKSVVSSNKTKIKTDIEVNPYQTLKYTNKNLYLKQKDTNLKIQNQKVENFLYSGCEFKNVSIQDCQNTHCIYINNVYNGIEFVKCVVEHCQCKSNTWTGNFSHTIFRYNIYIYDILKDTNITNCKLYFSSYSNMSFINVKFIDSSWNHGIFHNSLFKKCTFKKFKGTNCRIQKCIFLDCIFDEQSYKLFNPKQNKIVKPIIEN